MSLWAAGERRSLSNRQPRAAVVTQHFLTRSCRCASIARNHLKYALENAECVDHLLHC